jgi:folate-binding protein YgfZ
MTAVTFLHDVESAAGASFQTYCGWEVAAHFGDPRAEYEALRHKAGALDFGFLGRLCATGRDRVRFLNNMLTNDIKSLETGGGCYAALLTRQGRMESDLWLYAFADELWLECPPCATEQVLETFNRHIVSDAVKFDALTQTLGVLSLQGPKAGEIMERVAGTTLSSLGPLQHRTVEGNTDKWVVVCRDRTGFGGYDLWLRRADLSDVWRRWIETERVQPAGLWALDWARTEAGIPWYGTDMDDKTLPMEMGLDTAISMSKGCYRGQEIVARVTRQGHLDRKLAGIVIDCEEPPSRGTVVRSQGAKIGEITSAVSSPRLGKPLALAVLKTDFLQPGTSVEVALGESHRPGKVIALPLRD